MRIAINLASEPFRRDRAMFAASVVVGLLMLISLGLLVWLAVNEHRMMADTRGEMAGLEAQIGKLNAETAKLETTMRRADNAEVLERSLFLNGLLARKGISWTKIFSDLESVMPHNVRLASVRPQVTPQNQVMLEMVVGSQTPEPVIELLRRLEAAPAFGSTTVHSGLPPSQTEPLYRYRISVNYAQKL
jgi:type IV pilus assembly protein PilN